MRVLLSIALSITFASTGALAGETTAPKTLTPAERARVQAQVEALQKSKMDEAERAKADIKKAAIKEGQAVDQKVKNVHDQIDRDTEGMSWIYGRNAAGAAGHATKQQVAAQGAAEKQRIAKEAQRKAAAKIEAAKKSAQGVTETVEGLKSQVSKDGKFGLQPQGSNLNVRNYGK